MSRIISFFGSLFASSPPISTMHLALLDDRFRFDIAALDDDSSTRRLTWSQDQQEQEATYVQVTAWFVDPDKAGVATPFMLFLQEDMVDEFRGRHCDATSCTATISSAYQYGQDKAQTFRFVVYHDTTLRPYQHRFLASNHLTAYLHAIANTSATATDLSVPEPDTSLVQDITHRLAGVGQDMLGDYLNDF